MYSLGYPVVAVLDHASGFDGRYKGLHDPESLTLFDRGWAARAKFSLIVQKDCRTWTRVGTLNSSAIGIVVTR
jgi:hypothetical protein